MPSESEMEVTDPGSSFTFGVDLVEILDISEKEILENLDYPELYVPSHHQSQTVDCKQYHFCVIIIFLACLSHHSVYLGLSLGKERGRGRFD